MHIGVFYPDDNKEHLKMLLAFAKGLKYLNIDHEFLPLREYRPVDMAVVFGVGKKNVPASYARGAVIAQQKLRGMPFIVIEKGYVKRDIYYAVGLGGLNGRAYFRNENMPPDRWTNLGVEMKPWKLSTEGHVLVCGQVPHDASVQHINFYQWCDHIIKLIRQHTDKTIRFRPHPLANFPDIPRFKDAELSFHRNFREDIENASSVVTFNSNAGVDAVINGIPAYAFDIGSMIKDVANNDIETINNPKIFDRNQWAADIAYTQWNEYEFERGLPWLHLLGKAK